MSGRSKATKRTTDEVPPTLQELATEKVTEVLPRFQNLFFEGQRPSRPG